MKHALEQVIGSRVAACAKLAGCTPQNIRRVLAGKNFSVRLPLTFAKNAKCGAAEALLVFADRTLENDNIQHVLQCFEKKVGAE